MKYLFVEPRFHTNNISIVEELLNQHHQVEVYVQYQGFSEDYTFLVPHVMMQTKLSEKLGHYIDKKYSINKATVEKIKAFIPAILPLKKEIKQYHPDIVIVRDRTLTSLIVYWVCKVLGIKTIILYNQSPLYMKSNNNISTYLKRLFQWCLFPRVRITTVEYSEYPKEALSSYYRDNSSFYIPFVSKSYPEISGRSYCKEGQVRILDVGKYRDYKNHYVLADAVSLIKNLDFSVTIIGQCSNEEEVLYYTDLEKYIYSKQLENRIQLLTNIKYQDMKEYYLNNDIFVLTSSRELASIAVLEAMSYGLATISTSANGTAAYIQKGCNGDIFKTKDSNDLAKILRELILDKKRIVEYGQNAYLSVCENFTPQKYVTAMEHVVKEKFRNRNERNRIDESSHFGRRLWHKNI